MGRGLPYKDKRSATILSLRGYFYIHLRYGLYLCRLGTHDPCLLKRRSFALPKAYRQLLGRDFNPLAKLLLLRTSDPYIFIDKSAGYQQYNFTLSQYGYN